MTEERALEIVETYFNRLLRKTTNMVEELNTSDDPDLNIWLRGLIAAEYRYVIRHLTQFLLLGEKLNFSPDYRDCLSMFIKNAQEYYVQIEKRIG